jgi:hypothetical protein
MVLVLVAAVLAVLLGVALFLSIRADRRSTTTGAASTRLPVGAEAAIWSILEAVPDPRNHLALTRDLTGEVRITGTPLDPAFRAANRPATTGAPDPEDASIGLWGESAPAVQLSDGSIDLRTYERAS